MTCGGRHNCSAYHAWLVWSYREAREAWEARRESECRGWASEERDFGRGPTFAEWLSRSAR